MKYKLIHGAVKVSTVNYVILPFVFAAPLYTYYMASVATDQQKPFPHTTITDTACHYPQSILFRFIMSMAGSYLSFIFVVIFSWVKYQKMRVGFSGDIYGWISLLSQVSVSGYMAAMGTIDGAFYPDLHTQGAIFFFVVLFITVVSQTYALRKMHDWDTTVLSKSSYVIKSLLALYLILIWAYSIFGLVFGHDTNYESIQFIVILQWNSVYACLAWILSFKGDWDDIYMTLSEEVKTQQQQQQHQG